MKHDLELFLCKNKTPKTLITPIIENDWQKIEQERLDLITINQSIQLQIV
jgi:hypothetical protein